MAVLYQDSREVASNTGNSARLMIGITPHDKTALMIATAHGTSHYDAGSTGEAGMLVTITGRTNGVSSVVQSDSLDGYGFNVTFNASTTLTMVVQPNMVGQIIAEVTPIGARGGNNHDTRLELHVVTIDI